MARRAEPRPELRLKALQHVTPNRTDNVFDQLKEAILAQTLAPDTPLIEAQLAETFGTSKTPVREALLRLAKEGLVHLENAKGAKVHRLGAREARDIFEMRLHLEPLGLEQSIVHLTLRDLGQLEKLLASAEKAIARSDFSKLSQYNIAFHRGLYARAPNQLLVQWLDSLNDRRRLLSVQGWQLENRSQSEWQEHRAILEAVKTGQTTLACQLLRKHIKSFFALLEKNLED